MNGQLTVKTMKITFLKFLYVYMICCGVHNVGYCMSVYYMMEMCSVKSRSV